MPTSATSLGPEALKLAFLRHLLGEVARADHEVRPEEAALIDAVCPPDDLRRAGLVDALGQPTELGKAAGTRALVELPALMTEGEKLDMLTQLIELSVVDGQIDRNEGSVLLIAAELLGLSPSALDRHLDTLTEHVGALELDTPVQIED